MRFHFAFAAFFTLLLAGCAAKETRSPSAVKTPEQVMQERKGFLLKETTAEFLRYDFRDRGEFLISVRGFKNRPQAEGFCSIRDGFELADVNLPGLMAKAAFPFSDLNKSSAVGHKVLNRSRSGHVFWVKGATIDEEVAFGKNFDTVLEIYDNCQTNCTGISRLSAINGRITGLRGKKKEPQAICVSSRLKRTLASE